MANILAWAWALAYTSATSYWPQLGLNAKILALRPIFSISPWLPDHSSGLSLITLYSASTTISNVWPWLRPLWQNFDHTRLWHQTYGLTWLWGQTVGLYWPWGQNFGLRPRLSWKLWPRDYDGGQNFGLDNDYEAKNTAMWPRMRPQCWSHNIKAEANIMRLRQRSRAKF